MCCVCHITVQVRWWCCVCLLHCDGVVYITASLIPSSKIIRAIQAQTVKKYMWFQYIPHLHL